MEDKEYIDWFNKGYSLSAYKPELAKAIREAMRNETSDKAQGFIEGAKQYETEITAEKSRIKRHQNYKLPAANSKQEPTKDKIQKEK
ncbi:MAG: hypothetical protein JNK00_00275 [Flavipsychrobacter sp.]|nr:hypothetical protein [Flavipsychrobacter sp.]